MKELLTVQEFSKFSGIATSTLRYWDKIGLFSPTHRNEDNSYRYYSPDQIVSVNFIVVLSNLNVPIKTINDAARDRTPHTVVELLETQEKVLTKEIHKLREGLSIIQMRRELINQGVKCESEFAVAGSEANEIHVAVIHREEQYYVIGEKNEYAHKDGFHEPFSKFCRDADKLRINLNFPIAGYHENIESFYSRPGRPDNFASLDPMGNLRRAEGRYLTASSRGYYGKFEGVVKKLKEYVKEHSLNCTGPVFSVYLHDELCLVDPSKYMVQVSVAVE